jgi:hypothetical protein
MTITLRPEREKAIAQAIQSGAYQSPEKSSAGRSTRCLRKTNAFTATRMR